MPFTWSNTASRHQKQPPASVATSRVDVLPLVCTVRSFHAMSTGKAARMERRAAVEPILRGRAERRLEPRCALPGLLHASPCAASPGTQQDAFGRRKIAVSLDHRTHPCDKFGVIENREGHMGRT